MGYRAHSNVFVVAPKARVIQGEVFVLLVLIAVTARQDENLVTIFLLSLVDDLSALMMQLCSKLDTKRRKRQAQIQVPQPPTQCAPF